MKLKLLLFLLPLLLLVPSGHAAAQTQVVATWTQSSSPGITGNKIYRSQTSGGPYTLLQTFSTPTTTCTDQTVQVGGTYYYVVTSLVGTVESKFSNEAKATVLPNAPTNLTVQ